MKKLLSISLVLLLIFTLSGCGTKQTSEPPPPADPAPATPPATPATASAPVASQTPAEPAEDVPETPAEVVPEDPPATEETIPLDPQERIAILTETVQQYIDSESYNFTYNEDRNTFVGGFTLQSSLQSCNVVIYIFDDMVAVRTSPADWYVPEETRDQVAIYITRVNEDNSYSFLLMDYEDGFVSARSGQLVEQSFPTIYEIDVLVSETLWSLEDYGDGLIDVALNKADPHEVYEAILAQWEED